MFTRKLLFLFALLFKNFLGKPRVEAIVEALLILRQNSGVEQCLQQQIAEVYGQKLSQLFYTA